MEKSRKTSLREELNQDMEQIEKEIAEHPELEKIYVTEEIDETFRAKIWEYENTKVKYKKQGIRWIVALAAVLVLILGLGMTSVGSKSYWKELLDVLVGDDGSARVINVEDMEKQKTEDIDELQVSQKIDQILGADVVWLRYKPKGMTLEKYEIDESLRLVRMIYKYKEAYIRYTIYASQEDSSWTAKEEDKILDKYVKMVEGIEIIVEEIIKPNQEEKTRVAKFEYEGIHYELKGVIEKDEFDAILENLYFL